MIVDDFSLDVGLQQKYEISSHTVLMAFCGIAMATF